MAHILVIDDEPAIRTLVCKALERAGHTTAAADDGIAGVASFARERPDLVVTDLLMPNQSGMKTIDQVRRLDAAVPILAISGGGSNGRMNFLATARTFPRVWTLEKPFGVGALTALVGDLLGGSAPSAPVLRS